MDNVADVRFVYTHTECYRSDDDDVVGGHKLVLHRGPSVICHSSMIPISIESGTFQTCRCNVRLLCEYLESPHSQKRSHTYVMRLNVNYRRSFVLLEEFFQSLLLFLGRLEGLSKQT